MDADILINRINTFFHALRLYFVCLFGYFIVKIPKIYIKYLLKY